MLRLIPAPAHRAAMPVGYALRRIWLRVFRPETAGVAVFILDEEDRILLLRQSYGPQGWTMPAGGANRDEDLESAARREVREELGCELTDVTLLHEADEIMHGAPNRVAIFMARAVGQPVPDNREVLDARWFARNALPDKIVRATRQRLLLLDEAGL